MNRRSFLGTLLAGLTGLLVPLPQLVPVKITPSPYFTLRDIKARRFDIISRAQIVAKNAIQKEEDENIFRAIEQASKRIS